MNKNSLQFNEESTIEVIGARVHNLKNLQVAFPRNQLVVITGLSGSGKSSLAFDTIYAEGQRRYLETFSAYSRQFLGGMERPDVDKVSGLSPVISIEQKTTSRNPRSTVGTITEVYDFLRLLYARAGEAFSYVSGKKMERLSDDEIIHRIVHQFEGQVIHILAPLVKGRKGHYRELFEQIRKQGYTRVRVDGEIIELVPKMQVDRYKTHDIEVVVDRLKVFEGDKKRLYTSVMQAMKQSKGIIKVSDGSEKEYFFSRFLMDPDSGISYDEPQPNTFSFNSPYGACPECDGLGYVSTVTRDLIIPNPDLSILKGGIAPLGDYKDNWTFQQLKALGKSYGFTLGAPLKSFTEEQLDILFNGAPDLITVPVKYSEWNVKEYKIVFEGILKLLEEQAQRKNGQDIEEFKVTTVCPVCGGARLKREALHFMIDGKHIAALAEMDLGTLAIWFEHLEDRMTEKQRIIGVEILKELRTRLQFLLDVGLNYLTLNRSARSLSGGEAQRIRLATQIGSQLENVLYILDEPSIGLHQRDNARLIQSLKDLRDIGNSVLVVEHDKDMILASDYVIDMGPAAGLHGGEVVAQGAPDQLEKATTLTGDYLAQRKCIPVPDKRRKGNGLELTIEGASGRNLKDVQVRFPLGTFIAVTGVSGSGKSSLIGETLYPILNQHFYHSKKKPLPYRRLNGLQHLDKVIEIDQSPIGRTPRSNPSTYTGVFSDIRNLFVQLPEAKIRGYKPGRFSFNVKGGRCETCKGAGMRVIEMNFLPDVQVSCETCQGKRYNRETLEVRYKGKSISDVLDMRVADALDFFEAVPAIYRKVKTLNDVGLGYLTLGQSSVTLSGGEAQRVKLSAELAKKDTGNTFYILDEPTTGLHFEDVHVLLGVLNRLVNRGNTVLVIEHNLDVIKVADWVIDLGPEGGHGGGEIVFAGTPEQLARHPKSRTAPYLKEELKQTPKSKLAYKS